MIRIGILGDIGSGKSFVAKSFGCPVFNADNEVGKLYKKNRKIFIKLNKSLPKHITQFPIKKQEVTKTILANNNNYILGINKERTNGHIVSLFFARYNSNSNIQLSYKLSF